MREALRLARQGWGRVLSNPLVGAVVVRDGEIVGSGFHAAYGAPHAETVAIENAGASAQGATLYVTLEPCAHTGKTPPCTEAILRAGISRVVYASSDPHPTAGGGAEMLRSAGVEVVDGVEREAARTLNARFFHVLERDAPYVALKFGLSLDAKIAQEPGRTTAVTGDAALREVHRLRAGFDAIMVGSVTARVDDPLLTIREWDTAHQPARVVVDTEARLPLDSRLVRTAELAPLWVLCAADAPSSRRADLERAGAKVLGVPRDPAGGLSLERLLDLLASEGLQAVLCEGGGRLGSGLLGVDRVARLCLFFAPRLIGDAGVPAFPGESVPSSASWRLVETRALGNDTLVVLDRKV